MYIYKKEQDGINTKSIPLSKVLTIAQIRCFAQSVIDPVSSGAKRIVSQ